MSWSPSAEETPPAAVPIASQQRAAPRLPRLSSRFGYRGDPMHGRRRMHSGIDIPGPPGTPILASAAGFVRFAGVAGGYGRMVEIAHAGGLSTRYAHLSRILVAPGAAVTRGDVIALMGSTGRSTGNHLHFEVRRHGRAANPLGYLGAPPARESSYTVRYERQEPHISRFARARDERVPAKEPF